MTGKVMTRERLNELYEKAGSHHAEEYFTAIELDLLATVREREALSASLFEAIKHGDQEHQDWLQKAIADHFAGRPVGRPEGSGNREALEQAKAERDRLREEIGAALNAASTVNIEQVVNSSLDTKGATKTDWAQIGHMACFTVFHKRLIGLADAKALTATDNADAE